MIPGALTSCNDGVKNGNEEGVDCGGPNCVACASVMTVPLVMIVSVGVGGLAGLLTALVLYKRCARQLAAKAAVVVPGDKGSKVPAGGKVPPPRTKSGKKVVPIQVAPSLAKQRGSIIQWLRHHSTGSLRNVPAPSESAWPKTPSRHARSMVHSSGVSMGNLMVDWSQHESAKPRSDSEAKPTPAKT